MHCIAYFYADVFWTGNQCNHQNFDSFLVAKKLETDFRGVEAKKKCFLKKNLKGPTKKTEIFKTTNFQKNFTKISDIGPWVCRID